MIKVRNQNRTESGYSRVSPRQKVEPVTTTITTTTTTTPAVTNRTYTPAVNEAVVHTRQPEQFVTPTSVLQQPNTVNMSPTVVQHTTTTHEFLQTRPFTNYIEGYQPAQRQLYGQTISPQPVQPLANKNLYLGSNSAANLHAVSPIKQPSQKILPNAQSPPQQTKHNRSLTVTSKPTESNVSVVDR